MNFKEELEQWKEEKLSPYCLNECKDTCCANLCTVTEMTEAQVKKAFKIDYVDELPHPCDCNWKVFFDYEKNDQKFYRVSLYFSYEQPHCPAYDSGTKFCHLQDDKPDMCTEFPFGLKRKKLLISSDCPVSDRDNSLREELEEICEKHDYFL